MSDKVSYIRNKSKFCHFGAEPSKGRTASVLKGRFERANIADPRLPIKDDVCDFNINVFGKDQYIGPGEEKAESQGLWRAILNDPGSFRVSCTNPMEIKVLGVPEHAVIYQYDDDGVRKPVGFFGATYILEDISGQRSDVIKHGDGRIGAIGHIAKLEQQAAAQAAQIEKLKAELSVVTEERNNLRAEVDLLDKDRKDLLKARDEAAAAHPVVPHPADPPKPGKPGKQSL